MARIKNPFFSAETAEVNPDNRRLCLDSSLVLSRFFNLTEPFLVFCPCSHPKTLGLTMQNIPVTCFASDLAKKMAQTLKESTMLTKDTDHQA